MSYVFLRKDIQERPLTVSFTKDDLMTPLAGQISFGPDPFPDRRGNEIVRTEIVGRELVLSATLEGDLNHIHLGTVLAVDGEGFIVTNTTLHGDARTCDIVATRRIGQSETKAQVLKRLIRARFPH